MGGLETTEYLLWGPLGDVSKTSQGVARGGKAGKYGGGESGGGGGIGDWRNRGGRDVGIEGEGDREGSDKLGEGGGPSKGGFWRGEDGIRSHVTGGGNDTQEVRGLSHHMTCGGGVKLVTVILNHRLTSSINFHEFLHSLQAGRGTGTSTLEAKLIQ